ncbi:MAG: ABC transporter ATP-binding protein [Microcella pacifica]|uniref:ABC transporter ATP-binding protein n=1 Tax=Microcella pacifica TaxID=2591847 RepID=UPI00331565DA
MPDTTDVPTAIELRGVSKTYTVRSDKSLKERLLHRRRSRVHARRFEALQPLDLVIGRGETVGLIGANGSGKSTLLKLVGGILRTDTGEALHRGRVAALLELGAGFHPDLTGRDNVYLNAAILGLSREETREHFDEIVEFAGIGDFIDVQVKFYSSGMYVRLAFAIAVHVEPDILLVDEVLAVGDEAFQKQCFARLRALQAGGCTIVLVTHGLASVIELCTRAIVLDHGRVVADTEPQEAVAVLRGILGTA